MRRHRRWCRLVLVLGLADLVVAVGVEAQPAGTMSRIGVLMFERPGYREALVEGLRDLDYVEGRNLILEWRVAAREDELPELAGELVRLSPHVIVAFTGRATRVLKVATKTIPIVVATTADAVAMGLVTSLAHPGGNVTGFTNVSPDLVAKRLQILKEAVPRARRIAVLACQRRDRSWSEVQAAAQRLELQLVQMFFRQPEEVAGLVEKAKRQRVDAVLVLDCSNLPNAEHLADLLNRTGLPAGYAYGRFVRAGGLMSYGVNTEAQVRRAAVFIDKILKGAKPADLPVEQPTKFELVINLQTAKALRLTIPQAVIARADQVLE